MDDTIITPDHVTVERWPHGKGHELRLIVNGEQRARVGGKRASYAAALVVVYGRNWNSDGEQVIGYWGSRADMHAVREAERVAAKVPEYAEPGAWVRAIPVTEHDAP